MLKGKRTAQRSLSFSFLVLSTIVTTILIFINAPAMAAAPDVSIAAPITESATAPTLVIPYEIAPNSNFFSGCLGPCMCPVQIGGALTGTFDLTHLTPTTLFTRYSMTNISWEVIDSQGMVVHKITGNGIYEISRGAPLKQQMTLFLSIDGQPLMTFDSGLVPEMTRFPKISIKISHGTCFGYWMTINAIPK